MSGIFNEPKDRFGYSYVIYVVAYDSNFTEITKFGLCSIFHQDYPSIPNTDYKQQLKIDFNILSDFENIAYYKLWIGYHKDVKVDTLKVQLLKTEENDSTIYDYEPYGYKSFTFT